MPKQPKNTAALPLPTWKPFARIVPGQGEQTGTRFYVGEVATPYVVSGDDEWGFTTRCEKSGAEQGPFATQAEAQARIGRWFPADGSPMRVPAGRDPRSFR